LVAFRNKFLMQSKSFACAMISVAFRNKFLMQSKSFAYAMILVSI
jgi:hypothetical protein